MVYSQRGNVGMVFSMTNETCNKVVAIIRDCRGKLSSTRIYETGGSGSGVQMIDPLGSQGSVVLSKDEAYLFVVNAGSNTISSFRIRRDKLILVGVVPSGGIFPNSLAVTKDRVYVTHVGDDNHPSNVVGFFIESSGRLSRIKASNSALSEDKTGPGNIIANPCGSTLTVSEKETNKISIFETRCDGTLIGPVVNSSSGETPFGMAYVYNRLLVVTEAATNALSSYEVKGSGHLNGISESIKNNQKAVCWVSITPNKHFAYTSNAGSGTITGYYIACDGRLQVLGNMQSVPNGGEAPLDNGIDKYGHCFYVLNAKEGSISVFQIEESGYLTLVQVYKDTRLPAMSAQGLAVL